MTNTKELILEIKRVKDEQVLTNTEIKKRMEENGDTPLSDATLSRIFTDGSEENRTFSYDYTLIPLARAVLDIENIETDDEDNVKVLKELLKLKHEKIKELEQQLDKEKLKRHEQVDEVRAQSKKSLDYLREQEAYKEAKMNEFSARIERLLGIIEDLLSKVSAKDSRIESLTCELLAMKDLKEAYEHCPYRKEHE